MTYASDVLNFVASRLKHWTTLALSELEKGVEEILGNEVEKDLPHMNSRLPLLISMLSAICCMGSSALFHLFFC